MRLSLRSLGSLAGALAAVAGGIGAAVGFYTVPDPLTAGVGHDAYVRADERAIAVAYVDNGDGTYTQIRIDVGRGGSAGEETDARADGFPQARGEQAVGIHFSATYQTCNDEGECYDWQDYSAEPWEPVSVDIDPLLRSASVSALVQGCQIDVTWIGEGEIAPFAGLPGSNANVEPWNARVQSDNGYAEASRVAPAQIASCFGSFANANGYLSRGMRRMNAEAGGGFRE